MARKWWLALLALLIVTPALAQVMVQPIQKVQPIPTVPIVRAPDMTVQQNNDAANKVMTIEEARARISQLTQEKRAANEKLKEALARIDEITKPGGSLVRAYCASPALSRNTAGAEENCSSTGYVCGEVAGLCKTQCTTSNDCAAGYTCDVPQARCVRTG